MMATVQQRMALPDMVSAYTYMVALSTGYSSHAMLAHTSSDLPCSLGLSRAFQESQMDRSGPRLISLPTHSIIHMTQDMEDCDLD